MKGDLYDDIIRCLKAFYLFAGKWIAIGVFIALGFKLVYRSGFCQINVSTPDGSPVEFHP